MNTKKIFAVSVGLIAIGTVVYKLVKDYKKNVNEIMEEVDKVEAEFKEAGVEVSDLNKGISDNPNDPKRYSNLPWMQQLKKLVWSSSKFTDHERSINTGLGVDHGFNANTLHVWTGRYRGEDCVNVGILVPPYFLEDGRTKPSTYSMVLSEIAEAFWAENKIHSPEAPKTHWEGWFSVMNKMADGTEFEDISTRISTEEMLNNSVCSSPTDGLSRLYTRMYRNEAEELLDSPYDDMYVFVKVDFPMSPARGGITPIQALDLIRRVLDTKEITDDHRKNDEGEVECQKIESVVLHPGSDLGVYVENCEEYTEGRIIYND